MKRNVIAIVAGGLFALPAFANNEIDAGNLPRDVTPSMTRDQVRAELVAAQRAGQVIVNAELGTMARKPAQLAGKTRQQVRAELIAAQRAGDVIVNAELGLTARQAYPALYVEKTDAQLRAALSGRAN
jgi:hypothetical protein